MAVICPTVTATDTTLYRAQLELVQRFAPRLHIDLMDGYLAPVKSVSPDAIWWQPGPKVDIHVMYQRPKEILEILIRLQPHMVILHASAEDLTECFKTLQDLGISCGLALLPEEKVNLVDPYLGFLDHVLIFSGHLGHFGGVADLSLLDKVTELKKLNPDLEIGWDGGIDKDNAKALADGGVNVLNVGGFIQNSSDPENAYDTLLEAVT